MKKDPDYDYFLKRTDWSDYAGEWVAICDKKVVANGKKIQTVIKKTKRECKTKKPLFTKIPRKDSALLL